MRFSQSVVSRTMLVMLVFITAALVLTPRSGAALNGGHGVPPQPLTSPIACPTAVYCYEIVNYNASDNNYVTGINEFQEIVGAYSSSASGPYGSFVAKQDNYTAEALSPYSTLLPEKDGTLSTYLSGLDDGTKGNLSSLYQVGYAAQPLPPETEGVVRLQSSTSGSNNWESIHDPSQGTGNCNVTEVLADNDSRMGVGFYETNIGNTNTCVQHAFEFYLNKDFTGTGTYVNLTPPDPLGNTSDVTASQATGINILGDVVGNVTWKTNGGVLQTGGWIYRDLKYTTFCYASGGKSTSCTASALPTYANGINFSDVVVGNYTENGAQNGFAITNPWQAGSTFTTIDAGDANTVLWSISEGTGNDKSEFFAGWTTPAGTSAKASGVVGICKVSHCNPTSTTTGARRLSPKSRRAP